MRSDRRLSSAGQFVIYRGFREGVPPPFLGCNMAGHKSSQGRREMSRKESEVDTGQDVENLW